jgi:hypothetical protein
LAEVVEQAEEEVEQAEEVVEQAEEVVQMAVGEVVAEVVKLEKVEVVVAAV